MIDDERRLLDDRVRREERAELMFSIAIGATCLFLVLVLIVLVIALATL